MLAQTNSTPDEHICSLAAYMHVHMRAYAPVLAHPYFLMHTLQYVQYDHSICNHTIIRHTCSGVRLWMSIVVVTVSIAAVNPGTSMEVMAFLAGLLQGVNEVFLAWSL